MPRRDEKTRRAALRKAAGLKRNSVLFAERQQRLDAAGERSPRRADFLVAYACFQCRKSFKKPFAPERHHVCPQCAGGLAHMGRSFKAPRKTELKQWAKVQHLWDAGYRFHTNTTRAHIAPYPSAARDVTSWIAQNPKHPFRLREYWPKP